MAERMDDILVEDEFHQLATGVTLHAKRRARRDAGGGLPVFCLPGLTRNERDFASIATILAQEGHDVRAVSLRGRGRSSYADYRGYHPAQYRDDVIALLDKLRIDAAAFIGTSLGGITTMLIAEQDAGRIRAAVINDIGPELAPEGIARIMSYMATRASTGSSASAELSFDEAKASIRAVNDVAFPEADEAFWDAMTERTFRRTQSGAWTLDYDQNISRALAEIGAAPDLSPGWKALAAAPSLLVRGAISDLLSPAIVDRMRAMRPGFEYVEAANVGHAPMLDEPDVRERIVSFLAKA
ncbi:MAG: alpha/beta fold hydrolase [Alphaproteobacteria bacterium]|nr:alpha/beta fold hydrolase [Alphaproteobacteria bacterium]